MSSATIIQRSGVDMSILGSLIGAGTSLLGGLLGKKSADKANDQQMDLAKNTIQYRVADANAAGVHPLYAMGAPTMNFQAAVNPLPDAIANMGQDLSRAVSAGLDGKGRVDAYTAQLRALQLQRGGLENELLKAQIRNANSPGLPPAAGGKGDGAIIDGQGDSRSPLSAFGVTVKPKASESPAQDWENEYGEFGGDMIGAARLARDADVAVTNYLWGQWEKVKRGEPNDLIYWKRPKRSSGW